MSAKKLFFVTVVLLGMYALVAGCVNDTVSPTDEAPILPPANVTASPSESQKLLITWDPCPNPMLEGYKVYRLCVDSHDIVVLTPVPIVATSYSDRNLRRGVAYEYRVTAVTKSRKESMYSAVSVLLQTAEPQDPGFTE